MKKTLFLLIAVSATFFCIGSLHAYPSLAKKVHGSLGVLTADWSTIATVQDPVETEELDTDYDGIPDSKDCYPNNPDANHNGIADGLEQNDGSICILSGAGPYGLSKGAEDAPSGVYQAE